MDQIIEAISALSGVDNELRKQANTFLQTFQKSVILNLNVLNIQPEAWTICATLLSNPEANIPIAMFAAQTIRQKVNNKMQNLIIPGSIRFYSTRQFAARCIQKPAHFLALHTQHK